MDPAGEYGAVVELVRTLKGAPSSVLWALFLSQRPHTKSELEAATGYSDKPIKRAMDYLESRGLVQRHGSRWSLSERIARNFSEHNRRFSDRNRNISGQNRNLSASEERIVAVVDLDEDKDHIQQQQICRDVRGFSDNGSGESELEALLRRIGVIGRAFDRLSKRPDLQAQPLVVLAWWWYFRAQKWAEKPAGAVIRRLEDGHSPPAGYLELARTWQEVSAEDRQEIEERHWRGWSSKELAHYFVPAYPGLTAEAFTAFIELYQRAPDELDMANV